MSSTQQHVPAASRALPIACAFALPFALAPRTAHAQGEDAKDCAPGQLVLRRDRRPLPPGRTRISSRSRRTAPPRSRPPLLRPSSSTSRRRPPSSCSRARRRPPTTTCRARPRRKKEWGLNLHVGGLCIGKGRDDNAGHGASSVSASASARSPAFAIEADLDFAGGRDYNGFRRKETAFGFNGLVFLNPKSKTQVYFLGGFGWSGATAIDDRVGFDQNEYKYGYFGGQAGVGLEFRLSKVVALNFDLRGFVRGRIDDRKRDYPEFVDNNGRTTNTSGGGLFQGGLTFYW